MTDPSPQHYFTTSVNFEGMTAQLWSFDVLYKFGRSLGYTYAHSSMQPARPGEVGIYTFLGLEDWFDLKIADIEHDCTILDFGVNTIPDLVTYDDLSRAVHDAVDVAAAASEKPVCVRFWYFGNDPRPERGTFQAQPGQRAPRKNDITRPKMMRWQELSANDDPLAFDFQKAYTRARRKDPRQSRFEADKFKLLVHIRQGDTALIETPWNTFITSWNSGLTGEFTDPERPNQERHSVSVQEFFETTKQITELFPNESLSTIVASDGFERGLQKIVDRHKAMEAENDLRLSNEHIEILKDYKSYDEREFSRFNELDSCQTLVGETYENLTEVIGACLDADAILFGPQQSFIAKLMSIYSDPDNAPVMIMLHRDPSSRPVTREHYFKSFSVHTGPLTNRGIPFQMHQIGSDLGPIKAALEARGAGRRGVITGRDPG